MSDFASSWCDGCPPEGRRDFLKDSLATVAAALVTIAAAPLDALAIPIRAGAAIRIWGNERTYAVPPADGAVIDKGNEVILVRYAGAVYAFALSCPHQNTALRWLGDDSRFQCPKHKSKYQPDGTFMSGKATRNMDRYAVSRKGKLIAVDREP
jgi:Ferredoxin subunits of nitrite reductase and ring-hydroxylating dioxygenases